jgi:hypothetical protein
MKNYMTEKKIVFVIYNLLFLVFIFFIFIVSGCGNNKNELILSRYPSGKLENIIKKTNDSSFVYMRLTEDGNVVDSLPYVYGYLMGLVRTYENDNRGALKVYTPYIENKPYGTQRAYYYESGEKRFEGTVEGYNRKGEWRYYNKDGSLSAYIYYNKNYEESYFRKYGKDSIELQETGSIFAGVLDSKDWYSPGDSINIKMEVATPPDLDIKIRIGELSLKQGLINPIEKRIKFNRVNIETIAPKITGYYILTVEVTKTNKITKKSFKYNSYFHITVRNGK